jgi:hypothetical protein
MPLVQKNGVITEVSADQFPAPIPPTIEDIRAGAWLDLIDFIKALVRADILPPDQAIDAAKGNWPATFNDALAALNVAERIDAQIEWGAARTVRRNHPLIAMLAGPDAANLSAAQVDALFGITGS